MLSILILKKNKDGMAVKLDISGLMSNESAVNVQVPGVLKLVGSFISCSQPGLAARVPGVFRGNFQSY